MEAINLIECTLNHDNIKKKQKEMDNVCEERITKIRTKASPKNIGIH